MNKQKVFLRADANKQIGYGHFFRTLALANMLKNDFECTFFTASPSEFQKKETRKICHLVELTSGEEKFPEFLKYLTGNEIVFLDNYFFSPSYQKKIKNIGCKLVCIGPNDKHYYADILINTVTNNKNDFSAESYTRFLLGIEWALLRTPFHSPGLNKKRTEVKNVLICFGGTDQFFLSESVVEALNEVTGIENIYLLATDDFDKNRRKALIENGVAITLNASAQEIVHLFSKSDIAVLSTSTIAIEAIACKTPVIAGYYIENQKLFYEFLFQNYYITGLGNLLDRNMPSKLQKILNYKNISGFNNRIVDFSDLKERYIQEFNQL